jgi:hypothetical protein
MNILCFRKQPLIESGVEEITQLDSREFQDLYILWKKSQEELQELLDPSCYKEFFRNKGLQK